MSPDRTLKPGKAAFCRLHRHISEIESTCERLSLLVSKAGRLISIYRFVQEEEGDTTRQSQSRLTLLNVVWRNCLNSTCGKLSERNDRTRTKIITEPHELDF